MFLFSKMQSTGNDFIILNYIKNKLNYSYKLLACFLCDRHYGVGADGLLIVDKSKIADFKMRIFNKDGSEAEMCGNGIRCFAKYVYEKELISKNSFLIETLAGIKNIELEVEGNTVLTSKVNMGKPCFEKAKIPMIYEENQEKVRIDIFNTYSVSVGNPHTICFVEDVNNIDIKKYGSLIENYKYFPNRTNVEFVQVINGNTIKIRIWERGVGETLSCGTGAVASSVVSQKYKQLEKICKVEMPGGALEVEELDGSTFLKGPAEFDLEKKIGI